MYSFEVLPTGTRRTAWGNTGRTPKHRETMVCKVYLSVIAPCATRILDFFCQFRGFHGYLYIKAKEKDLLFSLRIHFLCSRFCNMKVNVSAAAAIATVICFSSHGVFAQQTLQKPTSQFPWNEAYPQPGVVPQPKPEWLQLLKNETIPKAPVNQAGPGGAFLQRTKNIELQCFGTKPQETNRRCALFFFFFFRRPH